jgi:hypothetical protein
LNEFGGGSAYIDSRRRAQRKQRTAPVDGVQVFDQGLHVASAQMTSRIAISVTSGGNLEIIERKAEPCLQTFACLRCAAVLFGVTSAMSSKN